MEGKAVLIQTLRDLYINLIARQNNAKSAVTVDKVKQAIKESLSLDSLFAADPGSLDRNLSESQYILQTIQELGFSIEEKLCYPVIVISTVAEKEEAILIWKTSSEREALNKYPDAEEKEYAGYPAKIDNEEGKTVRYVCLDEYVNLRVKPDAVEILSVRVNSLIIQEAENLGKLRSNLTLTLSSLAYFLDLFAGIFSQQKDKEIKDASDRNERQSKENDEQLRFRARMILFIDMLVRLQTLSRVSNDVMEKNSENR